MPRNLGELVQTAADAHGDAVAFQIRRGFRLERLTYRQVGERARRVAAWLMGKGLAPGDRIAVWALNMPEYPLLYFGAWMAGIVVVPIDVRTTQEVLDRFISASGARLGLKSRYLEGTFGPPVAETFVLEDLYALTREAPVPVHLPAIGPDALCEIAYTSGTTGVPKGVMLTHGNLLAEVEALQAAFPLDRRERALSVLPLSHALEQTVGLLLPFTSGVRVSYAARVNAVTIVRTLQADQITCMIVVPELLRLILTGIERRAQQEGRGRQWQAAHRLAVYLPDPLRRLLFRRVHRTLGGRLRFFGCGGAPLDLRVAEAWERMGIRIYEGYGLTETSAAATMNHRTAHRLGTVGRPLPGVEVRIAADGEIQIRGRTVTPGYYENAELTGRAFVDGWFRTGDVGSLDADGFLRIHGREAFKIVLPDGRNVYVEDVERVLNRHPLVRESCVIGLEGERGETVHAVLLTTAPERAGEIVREVNRRLAPHEQVMGVTVWPGEDFPRTPILKVDRKAVHAAVRSHRGPVARAEVEAAPAAAAADPLAGIVARVAERPAGEIRDEAELGTDLGLDSIGRVELLSVIEEELGRVIEEVKVGPQTTVGELRRLVERAGTSTAAGAPARWPRSWWARGLRLVLQWALFRLMDRWVRLEVVHPERLARLPLPSILIFNYPGPYAPLTILRALPPRLRERVKLAVDDRLWRGRERWQGLLAMLGVQAFPFAKRGAIRASLDEMGRWLDAGYAVIISPEGDSEPDGKLLPFQSGTGLMAVEMQVPVVPFRLEGYHRLFAPNVPFPHLPERSGRVRLIVGEPVTFHEPIAYDAATRCLEQALINTR
jgi:long-chain acyl-CoA synthetase